MTVLFNGGLAVFILRGNWRRPVNVFFGLFLIALALWALTLISYEVSATSQSAIAFGKVAYAAALLAGSALYLFSLAFPQNIWPPRRSSLVTFGLAGGYVALLPLDNFLVASVAVTPDGNQVRLFLLGYLCFAAIFGFLFLSGLVRLWRKESVAVGPVRAQLLVIALSVTFAGIGGMYFNLILASPFVGNFNYLWTGPLFSTMIAVAVMYAVFRLHLFNAKVIAAELLIALLWVFTLLRTLLAADPRERILNGGLFALSVVIGTLLVKSVRDEVAAREALSEFMSFAAHELRNPVTVIRGLSANILESEGDTSSEVRKGLLDIRLESEAVLTLISQFLDKSKLELGQIAYDIRSVDVARLVKNVATGLKPRAEEKGLELSIELGSLESTAAADEGKLREVVGNLIENAIKYTKQGWIDVAVKKSGRTVRITVTDTGVGIPPETLMHLFRKFSRADAQKLNLLGTGLGLYLSKAFVEGMGGRIWAESEGAGRGSRFVVELGEA